jgi:hypothetical protein
VTGGVALYGRTYLDAEVEIPLELLATGKGKVDVEVRTILGGFPCNAARALAGRLSAHRITVVTRIPSIDLPRLHAALPAGTQVRAVTTDSLDWPPITVIVNPARECRLLRSGRPGDLTATDLSQIPEASLHVFARVDHGLVDHVARSAGDALVAWCAGSSGETPTIDRCDLACVNMAEAQTLVGNAAATTRELAIALAERAKPTSVRVVTGRGDAPTVAAVRTEIGVRCFESSPAPIPREAIRRLKGVGDVFAANFFVEATLDARGDRRSALDVERALAVAQAAAARFMTDARLA